MLNSFSCFYIEIAYSNFTFCGAYTISAKRNSSHNMDHMENIASCENVHTGLRQGQGSGPIVSSCANPIACIGLGPVTISVNKP